MTNLSDITVIDGFCGVESTVILTEFIKVSVDLKVTVVVQFLKSEKTTWYMCAG